MEKYIDAMIRQNLMQRQAERKKVDEIDIRQFPELTVNWVSGHKLRTETVSNDPAALAECVMRHREVNEQLHQVMFAENRETVQNIEDGGMEMGRM